MSAKKIIQIISADRGLSFYYACAEQLKDGRVIACMESVPLVAWALVEETFEHDPEPMRYVEPLLYLDGDGITELASDLQVSVNVSQGLVSTHSLSAFREEQMREEAIERYERHIAERNKK